MNQLIINCHVISLNLLMYKYHLFFQLMKAIVGIFLLQTVALEASLCMSPCELSKSL